ncbi:hypothetical protein PHYSODRAFT_354167 [Phytophthora sojae]|uniref:RxLR effector protein n=1 Tax=Phytophthora sojae (strain P6497) TaxID=1094619 RepID=G4Z9L0_PHYSP|nr:hypothetical protein PHYSODRAFT_354167 [Phytophthora sojae]EGZ19124.1 hypothetical protein PHYSODRAFT_354167 [Phytophthora sojae]|eukprot:XP_009521841.1 hypothetical protein PHYSODRAFT_354167 [Phytophthora sojae]
MAAKRFLRRNKKEEDSDSDEDRTVHLKLLDDVAAKAAQAEHKKAVDHMLAKAMQAQLSGESLQGLLTQSMLRFARDDREKTLFKQMYKEGISLEQFAAMMQYNWRDFEDVYRLYTYYTEIQRAAKKFH